jgi:integrase
LSPTTVKNHLTILKTLYAYAETNKKCKNIAASVQYRVKKDPRNKRTGYSDEEARFILEQARAHSDPVRRWIPWICAFSGARIEEVCGAAAADVRVIDGISCIDFRLENRSTDASLKTPASARIVPLHPALIAEGFLEYVGQLPKDGPLFPKLAPDRFGSRGGTGSKRISRWVRKDLRLTDPRKPPAHAWRHRFKTVCRRAHIEQEIHDALTGHVSGGDSNKYGEYEVRPLFEEIVKLTSPI